MFIFLFSSPNVVFPMRQGEVTFRHVGAYIRIKHTHTRLMKVQALPLHGCHNHYFSERSSKREILMLFGCA